MKKVFIDTDIIINFTKGFGDDLKELFESFRALDIIKPIGLLGGELMRTKTVLFIADTLITST